MKGVYSLILFCCMAGAVFGQAQKPSAMAGGSINCRTCHTTDTPTKEKPSLIQCPRALIKGYHPVSEAPEAFTMNEIESKYGPVKFSHRSHAEMAKMGEGCYTCHHYNHGAPIQQCKECHSTSRTRTDLGKPDLKGARHRQCVECHLQWSHSSDCNSCHAPKKGAAAAKAVDKEKNFPKVAAPDRKIYETNSVKGKIVTFFHNDHSQRFGLQCVDCHKQETCASCHDVKKIPKASATPPSPQPARTGSMDELHKECFSCHANDNCTRCHMDKPKEAFDHAKSAGWILNRFHNRLVCQRCHTTPGKFSKLSTNCETCHPNWQKKFVHAKSGLVLDETHAGLECESCHTDKNFVARPSCAACHPDKSYPKDTPGKAAGFGPSGKQP